MTATYFVLMLTFHGSTTGWIEAPRKYPSLAWCKSEAIKNKAMLGASFGGNWIKTKCEKRVGVVTADETR